MDPSSPVVTALFFNAVIKKKSMKKLQVTLLAGFAFLLLGFSVTGIVLWRPSTNISSEAFQRQWTYVSETSAVIYWQLADISLSANSFVEYGKTESLGEQTSATKKPRWAHWHRLNGLETGKTYHYRMVSIDPVSNKRTNSEIFKIQPPEEKRCHPHPR